MNLSVRMIIANLWITGNVCQN